VLEAIVVRAFPMGIKTQDGFRLFHEAVCAAANITGGNVHQLRPPMFGDSDHMFHTIDVGAEGFIHGREEIDEASAVDNGANAACQFIQAVRVESAIRPSNITGPHRNLAAKEFFAQLLREEREGGGSEHFPKKAFLSGKVSGRPHQDVNVFHLGVTIEQHPQDDLAQETVSADQENLILLECLSDVCQWELSGPRRPGK